MADTKISALPASTTPLAGTEVLPIVQSGVTRQVSVADLTAGRSMSAAELTLSTGNLIIGTAGKGIDFSADPSAPGMTSELFDDYEEGTWTPVPADAASGGNTGTAGSAYGTYVKTGNLVFVTCVLVNINTTGLTAGNSFFVRGLPFPSFDMPSTTAYYLSGGVLTSSVTIASPVTAYVQDNTSSAAAFFDSGGALLVSDLTSTAADFYFSLTYRTA